MDRGISWFYCCLNVAERTIILNTCEGLVLTLFVGIPLPLWDAFWLATSHNSAAYKDAFRSIYHLKIGTIETEDGLIDAVIPEDGFEMLWVANAFFVALPAAACTSGCEQSVRPTP